MLEIILFPSENPLFPLYNYTNSIWKWLPFIYCHEEMRNPLFTDSKDLFSLRIFSPSSTWCLFCNLNEEINLQAYKWKEVF